MKDEIKEILDIERYRNKDGYVENINLLPDEIHKLLDYITNLQEELKEYKMIFDAFSKRPYAHRYLEEKKKELGNSKIIGLDSEMIYKDYYDLKEENKRLKELDENYPIEEQLEEALKYENIYKSRNEKAIEYIMTELITEWDIKNDGYVSGSDLPVDAITPLLNILNGDDEE